MPLIAFLQIIFERASPPPNSRPACPPTDAWQSFVRDAGYEFRMAVEQPLAVAALLAIGGLLLLVAARPLLAPHLRVFYRSAVVAGIGVSLGTIALMPRLNLHTPALLGLATILLLSAMFTVAGRR